MRRANNNGAVQFKPAFQVEGNIFRPVFLGYFVADWLLYNFAAGSFHKKKLCNRLYLIEINFYSKNEKKLLFSHPLRDLGATYALRV